MLVHLQPGQIHVVDGRLSVLRTVQLRPPQQVHLILSSNRGDAVPYCSGSARSMTWYGLASPWLLVHSHSHGGSRVEGREPWARQGFWLLVPSCSTR